MAITYLFDTVVTMKEYNRDKWWLLKIKTRLFDKNGSGWSKQFIDLWIEIKTLIDTDFMEV